MSGPLHPNNSTLSGHGSDHEETPGPPERPQNHRAPPAGSDYGKDRARISVIAHLVWPDREVLQAATATRWTADLVCVTWPDGEAWIPVTDVRRTIELPPDQPPTSHSGR